MQSPVGKQVTVSFDDYNIENALAISLQDLVGTYVGDGSFYVGTDGSIVGTTSNGQQGCALRGKISETSPGAKVNLFKVNVSYYGSCVRASNGPDYVGYAYFMLAPNGERYLYSVLRPGLLSVGTSDTRGSFGEFFGGNKIR